MKYKNIVNTFLGIFFIPSIIFLSVIFYYDPLKIFHKPWNYKEYLQSNMREQALGILKYWDYDSLILGTSILENTSSEEASDTLGGKFINISMAGSDYFERSIILDYALKNKKIKKVLYSLDNLDKTSMGDPNYHFKNWDYLYDDNIGNDIKIYLNSKYLKCLFSFENKKQCMGGKRDFDRPKAWFKVKKHIATLGGFDKWIENKEEKNMKHAFHIISDSLKRIESGKSIPNQTNIIFGLGKMKTYLNKYVLPYSKTYPDTEFILIVPPYSRLAFAIGAQTNMNAFSIYLRSIKYLVRVSNNNPNIKIYAWGNNMFLNKIENYRDLTHFSSEINSWMLKSIQKNEGLLTIKNVDAYLEEFMKTALEYDFSHISHRINTEVY